MGAGKLVVVLAVGAAVLGTVYALAGPKSTPARPPHSGPPANAEFVPDPPEVVVAAGASMKTRAAPVDYTGMWVPNEGWEGVVEEITEEKDGPALRLRRFSSRMIGGECWIVALVDPDHGINKGQTVHVQGKIRAVRIQTGGGYVSNSIVLEEARVVSKP